MCSIDKTSGQSKVDEKQDQSSSLYPDSISFETSEIIPNGKHLKKGILTRAIPLLIRYVELLIYLCIDIVIGTPSLRTSHCFGRVERRAYPRGELTSNESAVIQSI